MREAVRCRRAILLWNRLALGWSAWGERGLFVGLDLSNPESLARGRNCLNCYSKLSKASQHTFPFEMQPFKVTVHVVPDDAADSLRLEG